MQIHLKDLRHCLDKADEISDHYQTYVLGAGGPEKSVEELLGICRVYLNKNVEVYELEVPVQHGAVLGHYLKFPDRFVINLQPNLSPDWQRFVLCKELFHVILDDPECRTVEILAHLEGVAVAFPVDDSKPGPAVASEKLAEIAAMEFLFPFVRRKEELASTPADYESIAAKYNIPQLYVEIYLSDDYMENIGALMPSC